MCIRRFIFVLPLLFVLSCKKDDTKTPRIIEGSISLEVHASHHSIDVPGIIIYLKKNATSFPGNDSSVYDYKGMADGYGHYTFTKLFPGNYYVHASGYDSLWHSYVRGNIPILLDETTLSNNEMYVNVEVSE